MLQMNTILDTDFHPHVRCSPDALGHNVVLLNTMALLATINGMNQVHAQSKSH